ncbi:hypothetical protein ACO0LF_17650 [Undibacterium sp. Di27W]|uniref:hypothetical protein n=1 Tax=Undibacterium sp. Di27W TaxID=3413036 RepID=UPI003BF27350
MAIKPVTIYTSETGAGFLLKQLATLSHELLPAPALLTTILRIGEVASKLTGAAPNMDLPWPPCS